MLRRLFLISFILFLSACADSVDKDAKPILQSQLTGTPLEASNKVAESINQLFSASANISSLTTLFDAQGVRFAPYYYVTVNDLVLTATDVSADWAASPPIKRIWGTMDGSGDSIELPVREYFSRFVWDFPYHSAAKVTLINSETDFSSRGNTINNVLEIYPKPQYRVVEYYQSGTNPEYGGMDWSSLMVVLKDLGDQQWSLVALIHGQWTI